MKKNKMLRLASALLILTLLTTSIIGGTFAKYVTTESGSDTARVAKFGVVATVSGDLFGSTYAAVDNGNTIISYSQNGGTVSANTEGVKVVAPGTENKAGLKLSAKGTPEVSTTVKFAQADSTNSDIYLKAGDYGVMVKYEGVRTDANISSYYTLNDGTYTKATAVPAANVDVYELRDTANVGDTYYPLTWYANGTAVANQAAVTTALETKFKDKEFKPNETLDLSANVGWAWEFRNGTDDDAKAASDKKDTILGDMISKSVAVVKKDGDDWSAVEYKDITAAGGNTITVAYTGTTAPTDLESDDICACLTVAFGASITVEQVD